MRFFISCEHGFISREIYKMFDETQEMLGNFENENLSKIPKLLGSTLCTHTYTWLYMVNNEPPSSPPPQKKNPKFLRQNIENN